MSAKILPCPFCGDPETCLARKDGKHYITCHNCLAEGSKWVTADSAINEWNITVRKKTTIPEGKPGPDNVETFRPPYPAQPIGCFSCKDSATPLYCLNCAYELTRAHASIQWPEKPHCSRCAIELNPGESELCRACRIETRITPEDAEDLGYAPPITFRLKRDSWEAFKAAHSAFEKDGKPFLIMAGTVHPVEFIDPPKVRKLLVQIEGGCCEQCSIAYIENGIKETLSAWGVPYPKVTVTPEP